MRYQSIKQLMAVGLVLSGLACPGSARADLTVHSGWDLFVTVPTTDFMGAPYVGVPVGNFDFGSGPVSVGSADTIVHRLANATVSGPVPPRQSTTIPLEMAALQLASATPISFGGGPLGTYYITLQSVRGGPLSGGSMTLSFDSQVGEPLTTPHGTFSSALDVFFDVRFGALNGPIVFSDDLVLTSAGVPWVHYAPPGALTIPGVNSLLDGTDINQDFWPSPFTEAHPGLGQHSVEPAPVPEPPPGMVVVIGLGLLVLRQWGRRNHR